MSDVAHAAEAPDEGMPEVAPAATKTMVGSAPAEAKPASDTVKSEPERQAEAKQAEPALFDPGAWKAPEGVKVDQEQLKGFSEIVNDQKLTAAQRGEKLLAMYQSTMEGATKQVADHNAQAWSDTIKKWEQIIHADAKIGGDKLEPTLKSIGTMLNALGPEGSDAFKAAMTITGAGSHPAVVRGMAKLAELFTEGDSIQGSPGGGRQKSVGALFFPNSPEMQGDT